MLSWKEKLSRLFSDSPASESSGLDQSQARLYSNEGKSLSSIFSFIFPPSIFDGFRSNKDRNNYVTIQSPPVTWESESISWQDNKKCDSGDENREAPISDGGAQEHGFGRSECEHVKALNKHADGDPGSARSTSSSDVFEDATSSLNVDKSMPHLTEESSFISSDLYEFLQSSLPNIVKGCQWILLYRAAR